MSRSYIYKKDPNYQFYSVFQPATGAYYRSGIIRDGKDSGADPFMASFPELLDVGVMGHCVHGASGLCMESGVQCYQDGMNVREENMPLSSFERIADASRGKTFQFALGGRGDVDMHEHFEELLRCCRESDIVPNFTTSGLAMDEDKANICKMYCGAVAVSWYRSEYTIRAVKALLKLKVKTNIHYVLSRDSLEEAIFRLKNDDFPTGINAVIFLLHKPVGLGTAEHILPMDERTQKFFQLIDGSKFAFKIGFDSCSVPAIMSYCRQIDDAGIDTCEGARWSAYITPDLKMLPCSFDNRQLRWAYDISADTMERAWNSEIFEDFRNQLRNACPRCGKRTVCMGGCPICPSIVLCEHKEPVLSSGIF